MEIDLSFWLELGNYHPYVVMWRLLLIGGWLPFVLALTWGLKETWLYWRQVRWAGTLKYIVLAVDVPRENDQSLLAMESFLSLLSGTKRNITKWEEWWHGMFQIKHSLEIVSIDGYIQYILRVEERYRQNVESGIYAHFPDAEVTEVEDYAKDLPAEFPNEEGWSIWGTEYELIDNPDFYPIKTWMDFEHQFGDRYFVDPIAQFLEMLASLQRGEQFWLQFVITPSPPGWQKKAMGEVNKLIERNLPKDKDKTLEVVEKIFAPLHGVSREILGQELIGLAEGKKDEENRWPTMMQHMTEGEKNQVKAIEMKMSKPAFQTRIRAIYWAKDEVFNIQRFVTHFHGYFKHFASDLNALSRNTRTKTSTDYFMTRYRTKIRKRKIVENYKSRENTAGANGSVFNIEELATLWHFPTQDVRAPLVGQVSSKRSEPPTALPVEGGTQGFRPIQTAAPKAPPPAEIPVEGT